jgi:hypothetical protein
MAKVKRNAIMQGLSGTLGKDYVFRQMKDGRTIISTKPDFSNRQFSEEQLDHQSRFQQAVAYAKAAMENPIYIEKAKGTSKNAYNIALSDWFNPPVIRGIERLDQCIRVNARDNVMITKVIVTILDDQGKTLEQGQAVLVYGVWWDYVAAAEGKIRVEAWDIPGNMAMLEL